MYSWLPLGFAQLQLLSVNLCCPPAVCCWSAVCWRLLLDSGGDDAEGKPGGEGRTDVQREDDQRL